MQERPLWNATIQPKRHVPSSCDVLYLAKQQPDNKEDLLRTKDVDEFQGWLSALKGQQQSSSQSNPLLQKLNDLEEYKLHSERIAIS